MKWLKHTKYDVAPYYLHNNVSGLGVPDYYPSHNLEKYNENIDAQKHRKDIIKRMNQ